VLIAAIAKPATTTIMSFLSIPDSTQY